MVIQIRVVIQVPKGEEAGYPEKIERIVEAVNWEFPGTKSTTSRSPVTVTIDEFQELTDKKNE